MQKGLDELIRHAEEVLTAEEEKLLHTETTPEGLVAERISRIQLCQRMIRNIRMNMLVEDTSGLQMRFNQIRAVSELIKFLEQEGGEDFKGRFKQPTGAGKTVLFGVITKLIGVKTLVLVPRQNLLSNTKKEFVEMVGILESDIGLVGAGAVEIGKQITIATYQSHMSRMKKDGEYRNDVQQCNLIVCDEAHRALGDATRTSIDSIDETSIPEEEEEISAEEEGYEEDVLRDLEQNTNRQSLKLAFTATPTLANKDVADHFPYLIAEEKQGDLVKAGILVPYRIVQVSGSCETDDFEGYLTEEQEADVLRRENVYEKLSHAYAEVLQRYRVKQLDTDYPLHGVVFCVNIAECDKFAAEAESHGLRARIVTSREAKGRKGDEVIADAEQALVQQQIDLIITVNKLGEGWNFKPANAAIWARASTSPMIVIQGVGRTCRTHTDEQGRTKPHSLVFETQWSLRGKYDPYRRQQDNRLHKKPLTIAQALALNGEDPTQVCSMENGTELRLEKFATLSEDGTATVEGIEYVEPIRYIGLKKPSLSHYAIATLLGFHPSVQPKKPAYPIVLRGRIQRCYLKEEIDNLLEESAYVPPDGVVKVTVKNPDDESLMELDAVYVPVYLDGKVDNPKKWLTHAQEAGLESLKGISALYRREDKARQKTIEVSLHAKDAVDEMRTKLYITAPIKGSASNKGLGEGVEITIAEGQKRMAIYPKYSPIVPKKMYEEVKARIEEKDVQPIPQVVIGGNGRPVTLYWKDEVEEIVKEINAAKEEKVKAAQRKKDEARRRELAASNAEAAKQRGFVQSNTLKEITPLDAPGVYFVRYSLVVNRGKNIIKGEGNAVELSEYVSSELGRKLTPREQEIVRRGLRALPTMPYYWQKEVDAKIRATI